MNIAPWIPLGSLVAEAPHLASVLERLGLDLSGGAQHSLQAACALSGLDLEQVIDSLQEAHGRPAPAPDWRSRPLPELIRHLEQSHHQFTRDILARVVGLARDICTGLGATRTDAMDLGQVVAALDHELQQHMAKEEGVLFPWIVGLVEGRREVPFGGSLELPTACLRHDHTAIDELMAATRALAGDLALENGAGVSLNALREALTRLDADLRQHVDLENNVLFPRALELDT